MKIIFNTGVFGKHGIEHALVNLLTALPKTEHEYILHKIYELDELSPLIDQVKELVTQDCSLPRTSFWGNLHMNRKRSGFHKLIDAIGLLRIHQLVAKNINQHNSDIVVDYDLSLLRSAHLITAPKIGFFHFRPKRFRNGGTKKLHRIGQRLIHYQKLVVLCDEMYEEACFVWPHIKDKLIVLPNPINFEALIKKSSENISLPSQVIPGKYFISIARLTHQKNIHLLLMSFKKARELGSSWPLIIIGDGEDKQSLIQLCHKLEITQHVFFLGYKSNPLPYLAKAGAFVMSSREEGFPVSLLESMALRCPIISLACPTGPSDILQNGRLGKLVEFSETNPKQLSLAMLNVSLDYKLRDTYSEKSYKFCQNFSSGKIAIKLMDLIKDCHIESKIKKFSD